MSNSSLVDYILISPMKTKMTNKVNKRITIHHMAGNLTVEHCGQVFQSRQASANYGVGTDGRVGLYVDEKDRSWASSSRWNDEQAVTIEVANDNTTTWHVSDKALEKTIQLCVDICRRNNIPKLTWTGDANGTLTVHRFFTSTACPGDYLFSKMPYIADEVNKRLNGNNGWVKQKDGRYKYFVNEKAVKNEWVQYNGKWYYLKKDGYMAVDEYIKSSNYKTNNKLYYVDNSGAWNNKEYCLKKDNKGKWLASLSGGWYLHDSWANINGHWYYAGADGYFYVNTVARIGNAVYSFDGNGALKKTDSKGMTKVTNK